MTKPELVLHHYWRSSCSWRVRWALALKGVPFTSVPVNILAGEQRAPAYLAQNPSALLPALLIDGAPFGESLALLEWVDETWPEPPLHPRDAIGRLRDRQLALTIVAGTQPLQNPSLLKHFEGDEGKRAEHARHWIRRGLEVYEELLRRAPGGAAKGTAFSLGDAPTVADLCLIPQVYNALRFETSLEGLPLVKGIYERARATEACKAAAPEAYAPA